MIKDNCKKQKSFKNIAMSFLNGYRLGLYLLLASLAILCEGFWQQQPIQFPQFPKSILPEATYHNAIYQLAQSTTVRIFHDQSSGSGIIINRQGEIYTVLTNWHVVSTDNYLRILTEDGQTYSLQQPPQRLGNLDLATIMFKSSHNYRVVTIGNKHPQVGDTVYSAGFPLYQPNSSTKTLSLGIQMFRLNQGEISLIPPKSMMQGYQLGYTNDIEVGMSGGPIFNTKGFLIGINGRQKYGDPDFGAYLFEDGSDPKPEMLETMVNSSWGIPITTYLKFAPQAKKN